MVKINPEIREEIAIRFCEEQSAGYDSQYMGSWYVVDGNEVVHAASNRPWNPWHDDAKVISVDELVREVGGADVDHASFDIPSPCDEEEFNSHVMFALGYVPDEY
jgi:hypothetical protein